ncbi:MAG TPA: hypothetical protein VK524_17910 [Polyangiaceae bacterium]|nr:hypothetical protein [Polyangiaceae bacterium]
MPFDILPLQNSTKKDTSLFSLAPVNCMLDSYDPKSRGKAKALTNGSYRIIGLGGGDGGILVRVNSGFGLYQVSWERVTTAPAC